MQVMNHNDSAAATTRRGRIFVSIPLHQRTQDKGEPVEPIPFFVLIMYKTQ